MPLMEMSIMDQKQLFILHWKANETSFSQLCRDFNISRPTSYKYVERYQKYGMDGLEPLSTAPHHIPNKTPEIIENAIIEYRKKHQRWGAKKIEQLLINDGIYNRVPHKSTIGEILKRNGLIPDRKKRKRVEPRKPIFDPADNNEIWSADYKGKFRMGNTKYCYPLTICDSFSRYIIAINALHHPTMESSKPVFEAVFREYGLPLQLHTDNGAPFASIKSLGRLTKFAVWLMELGIQPVYSDPASPQQNGRHERMHRELKAESCKTPGQNLQSQQRKFNKFRKEYNEVRPHEALGMMVPKSVYTSSIRPFPDKINEWEYPSDYKIKTVCRNGIIRVGRKDEVYITTALMEKKVGLEPLSEGIYRLYFRDFLLGYIDEKDLKMYDVTEYKYIPRL